MLISLIDYLIISLAALFVIINPLTTAFVFQSLMPYGSSEIKKEIAKRSTLIAASVLIIFSVFGNFIFSLFGITIAAFKIAGGLILFGIAMKMIKTHEGEHDEKHHTSNEMDSDDISVIPLAIPFMSGPGSIATVMLLTTQASSALHFSVVIIAIIIILLTCYFALLYSHKITEYVGETGKKVSTKLFGLILAVISVQFVINGVIDLIPQLTPLLIN